MESSQLFQLEDGSSLSFAIHEQVPQHARLCEMIKANHGVVTKDLAEVDFVIVSTSTPGFNLLVDALIKEEKWAIQDLWIKDSVDLRRVLPWYEYMVGTETYDRQMTGSERDLHELTIAAARYWPILAGEQLYQFVTRRCPHLNIAACRALHMDNKASLDVTIAEACHRLNIGLAPGGSLVFQPRLSFTSPVTASEAQTTQSKSQKLVQMQRLPSPIVLDITPALAVEEPADEEIQQPELLQEQYEEPANEEVQDAELLREQYEKRNPAYEQNNMALSEQPDIDSSNSSDTRSDGEESLSDTPRDEVKSNRRGVPVMEEDLDALARWIASNPRYRYSSAKQYFTAFQNQWKESTRSPNGWDKVLKAYSAVIDQKIREIKAKNEAGKNASDLEPELQSNNVHSDSEDSFTDTPQDKFRSNHNRGIPVTDKDIDALAKWIVSEPRRRYPSAKLYFTAFQNQWNGSTRTPNGWNKVIRAYSEAIQERIETRKKARRNAPNLELESQPNRPNSDSEDPSSDTPRFIVNNKNHRLHITPEDLDALARWMLSQPRSSYSSAKQYFTAFQNQWEGSTRTPNGWDKMVKAYSEAIEERMQKFNTGKEAQQKASNVGLESRPNDVRLNFTSTLKHANVVLACKIIDLFSTLANIKARSDSEYSSSDASRDEINLFKSKKSGVPVLQEDIDAPARWMLYEPRASYSSARKYFSKFQTQWNGSTRSPDGWDRASRVYGEAIEERMQQINPEKATQLKVSTSEPEPQLEVKAVSRGPRVTGEELDALAEYMLANPQGDRKQPEYYAAFQAQFTGCVRPPDSWGRAVRRHRERINARMLDIQEKRRTREAFLSSMD